MQTTRILLILSAACALAGCDKATPAEVREQGASFPVTRTWNATAAPVGTNTVGATLTVTQHLGFRMEATVTLTGGVASRGYQWRIFRGDCATTAVAANNTSPTGLLLFSTTQAYPDIVADASGRGTAAPVIAGDLDPQTAYSVRFRVTQSATNWNGTSPVACGNLQRSGA